MTSTAPRQRNSGEVISLLYVCRDSSMDGPQTLHYGDHGRPLSTRFRRHEYNTNDIEETRFLCLGSFSMQEGRLAHQVEGPADLGFIYCKRQVQETPIFRFNHQGILKVTQSLVRVLGSIVLKWPLRGLEAFQTGSWPLAPRMIKQKKLGLYFVALLSSWHGVMAALRSQKHSLGRDLAS